MFSSTYVIENAGSFFTNKKVAAYWIDRHHKEDTSIRSANYLDIKDIKIEYSSSWADATKIKIILKDRSGKTIDLYIEDIFKHGKNKREKETLFYDELVEIWKSSNRN